MRKHLGFKRTYAYVTAGDGVTKRRVLGYKTISPNFAITPLFYLSEQGKAVWAKKEFSITHVPTGASALKHFTSIRHARKVAAVFAGCPMDWKSVTVRNLDRRWKKMPHEIREWRAEMSEELFERYIDRCLAKGQ